MQSEAEILLQILAELRAANAVPLGFGHPPKPRYIYANRQYPDCLWYFWNGCKNEHEPILHHALTGTIAKLEIETKEFRGKPDPKLNLTIRADRTYIIQAGFDTLFAKGLLFTLAKLPSEAFRQPITIAVEPGETEQVLFCRIYNPNTGNSVYAPYPDDTDWPAVTMRAMDKINRVPQGNTANAHEQPPPEQPPPEQPPEIDGQGRILPDQTTSADGYNKLIREAKSLSELDQIRRDIDRHQSQLGPTYGGIVQRWQASVTALSPTDVSDLISQIGVQMERVGWTKNQGSNFLAGAYGKRTRAELTAGEMLSFLAHLKTVPTAIGTAIGTWE
ncbi:MAG: hypothetical protein RLZZ511_4114 [Cyanobacteriota bacterium]|jgi:hypothetical protein